ncbi:MAG: cytochrome c [Mariprofundaceae bacterium]|nr:cytochrome c [Mariprofundaceae bacterium]
MRKFLYMAFLLILMEVGLSGDAVAADKLVTTAKSGQATAGKTKAAVNPEYGKEIFKNICIHCHRTDYDVSAVGAPGLRDVMDRHTPEWLNQWLTNPAIFAKKDKTARALIEANPYGLTMPTLPEMQSSQSRKDVIEFLKTLKGD